MQSDIFEFEQGTVPILISMPHNGHEIPSDIQSSMTDSARKSIDTDWFLDRLYSFAHQKGCSLIVPKYSRYVIDLNRPEDDHNLYPGHDVTELCPTTQFDSSPIYKNDKKPGDAEIARRIEKYWKPYHQKLKQQLLEMKQQYGIALLFEAHSIKSRVPRFFDGRLSDFNFGNLNNQTCSDTLTNMVSAWEPEGFTRVVNGRFKGGYITRAYADVSNNIHSIQLELSQATYMDEVARTYNAELASQVVPKLTELIDLYINFVNK